MATKAINEQPQPGFSNRISKRFSRISASALDLRATSENEKSKRDSAISGFSISSLKRMSRSASAAPFKTAVPSETPLPETQQTMFKDEVLSKPIRPPALRVDSARGSQESSPTRHTPPPRPILKNSNRASTWTAQSPVPVAETPLIARATSTRQSPREVQITRSASARQESGATQLQRSMSTAVPARKPVPAPAQRPQLSRSASTTGLSRNPTTTTIFAKAPLIRASSSIALPQRPTTTGSEASYNPLHNYIPCMHPSCSAHYTLTTLSPMFYASRRPYNLKYKKGLCPDHAFKDFTIANEQCKKMYERMRQCAGRKTLNVVAAEFDAWVAETEAERQAEGKELVRKLKARVRAPLQLHDTGSTSSLERSSTMSKRRSVRFDIPPPNTSQPNSQEDVQWLWVYTPRPCTSRASATPCQTMYSPFDTRFYPYYTSSYAYDLSPLPSLCPTCAKKDLDTLEELIATRKAELAEGEWRTWLKEMKFKREGERRFWERAQERVVRERIAKGGGAESGSSSGSAVAVKKSEVQAKATTDNADKKESSMLRLKKKGSMEVSCSVM